MSQITTKKVVINWSYKLKRKQKYLNPARLLSLYPVGIQFWREFCSFTYSIYHLNQNIMEKGEHFDEGQWSPLTLDSESSPVTGSGSCFHLHRNHLLSKKYLWHVPQTSHTSPLDSSFLISTKGSICRLQLLKFWNIACRRSSRIGRAWLHPGVSHCFRKGSDVKAELGKGREARAQPVGVRWAWIIRNKSSLKDSEHIWKIPLAECL